MKKNTLNYNKTFQEFLEIVNPSHKMHDSDSYSGHIEIYRHENKFNEDVYDFDRFGIKFSLRMQITDLWANHNDYSQKDKNGEPLRTKNGNGKIIYHTKETIKKIFPAEKRFEYEHAIFDTTNNKLAARTQDEWGALLIQTDPVYAGFSLGEELLYHHRKTYPVRDSGGYSPQGYLCEKRVFRRNVLENMDESLPEKRKAEILDSVSDVLTFSEREHTNKPDFNLNNSDDFLVRVNERSILIYNKKLYEELSKKGFDSYTPAGEFILKQGIIGYMDILGTNDFDRIHKMYYKNDQVKENLLKLFSSYKNIDTFETYCRDAHEFKDIPNTKIRKVKNENFTKLTLNFERQKNIKALNFIEEKIRKSIDPHEEVFTLIHERADSFAEDNLEKNNKLFEKTKNKKNKRQHPWHLTYIN